MTFRKMFISVDKSGIPSSVMHGILFLGLEEGVSYGVLQMVNSIECRNTNTGHEEGYMRR